MLNGAWATRAWVLGKVYLQPILMDRHWGKMPGTTPWCGKPAPKNNHKWCDISSLVRWNKQISSPFVTPSLQDPKHVEPLFPIIWSCLERSERGDDVSCLNRQIWLVGGIDHWWHFPEWRHAGLWNIISEEFSWGSRQQCSWYQKLFWSTESSKHNQSAGRSVKTLLVRMNTVENQFEHGAVMSIELEFATHQPNSTQSPRCNQSRA